MHFAYKSCDLQHENKKYNLNSTMSSKPHVYIIYKTNKLLVSKKKNQSRLYSNSYAKKIPIKLSLNLYIANYSNFRCIIREIMTIDFILCICTS